MEALCDLIKQNKMHIKTIQYALYLGLLASAVASCDNFWDSCIEGNGYRVTETRDLNGFEQIQINGEFDVDIDTGSTYSVKIQSDENLMDIIVTHVSGNRLIIESRNGTCLRPSSPIEMVITVPYVNSLTLNGSGIVYCFGMDVEELNVTLTGSGQISMLQITANDMELDLEGTGIINASGVTENVNASIEGSGEIRITGDAVNADLKIIGSGRIKAGSLTTEVCYAYISGTGIIDTHVLNALDVTIIGSGIVYYEGNPVVESYISGTGSVVQQ